MHSQLTGCLPAERKRAFVVASKNQTSASAAVNAGGTSGDDGGGVVAPILIVLVTRDEMAYIRNSNVRLRLVPHSFGR